MRDPVELLRRHFCTWVAEHNKPSTRAPAGYSVDGEALFAQLQAEIPNDRLRHIGAALQDGGLKTAEDGRGYFICERGAGSPPQPTVYHAGSGKVIPWWELYVQLSDYARLRPIAERRGLQVRMEDRQMDITVYAGEKMLLYVENKVTAAQAKSLLRKMRQYGETGFDLNDPDKGNDPLRKAKYLFRDDCRPPFFGLSAIGYEQLFAVQYLGNGNRFLLNERDGGLVAPLLDATAHGKPPQRSPADAMAVELERLAAERDIGSAMLWLSPGTGRTDFNAYVRVPEVNKDAIIVGAYKTGEVWSDLKAIGPAMAARLASHLNERGLEIDTAKGYPHWRRGSKTLLLDQEDAEPLADAVIAALAPS
jgi:hypothetical protein